MNAFSNGEKKSRKYPKKIKHNEKPINCFLPMECAVIHGFVVYGRSYKNINSGLRAEDWFKQNSTRR